MGFGEGWFDSELSGCEQSFFETARDKVGPYFRELIIPQANISKNISGEPVGYNRRWDFVVNIPSNRAVIEIDDEGHVQAVDREMDNLIEQIGYIPLRITNQEIIDKNGEGLSKALEFLEEIPSLPDNDEIINKSIKFAHQLQVVLIEALIGGQINEVSSIGLDVEALNLDNDIAKQILSFVIT